jgi:hypothetical protein
VHLENRPAVTRLLGLPPTWAPRCGAGDRHPARRVISESARFLGEGVSFRKRIGFSVLRTLARCPRFPGTYRPGLPPAGN